MSLDRQTLIFLIIMFIFLLLPNGADQPQSRAEREVLATYQKNIIEKRKIFRESEYYKGYGNLTGFELSYEDNLQNKNASNWPFREYTKEHPWKETAKDSILPNSVSDRVKEFWNKESIDTGDEESRAYLLNISGNAFGEFEIDKFSKELKPYNFGLPAFLENYFSWTRNDQKEIDSDRDNDYSHADSPSDNTNLSTIHKIGNISYSTGKVSISFSSSDYNFKDNTLKKFVKDDKSRVEDAVNIVADVSLEDSKEADQSHLPMYGIYFQDSGAIALTTFSAKFMGRLAFPHLVFNEKNFNRAKILTEQYINATESPKDIGIDMMSERLSSAVQSCEYVGYIQLDKTQYSKSQLREIDNELIHSQGIPLPGSLPRINITDALFYSPDCGISLSMNHKTEFSGNKVTVTERQFKKILNIFSCMLIAQLILFIKQIKDAKTPGQLSNISYSTLNLIAFQDALLGISFLLLSSFTRSLYLIISCITVLTFILCGIFEMRFLVSVKMNQVNEQGTTWWEILRGSGSNEPSSDSTNGNQNEAGPNNDTNPGELPPPVTAARPQPNVVGVNDEARYSNGVFVTGFALSIITTFFLINVRTWRFSYRRAFEFFGFVFINSYWVPQFFRNTLKNRRQAFSWPFVYGTSALRLLPILYLALYSENPFRHHYDPALAATVSIWVLVQLSLLHLQEMYGARFWINEKWLPKAYDYHPLLQVSDVEHHYVSDILASIKSQPYDPTKASVLQAKVDCSICMSEVTVPLLSNLAAQKLLSTADKLHQQKYMVTPCHHIFHTDCLEDWLSYKLQCPVCRSALPPV
ncbi:Piso0_000963 [Millerozyma farinosa CBS 7064]|uniref:RING-type E3 ubiquitin transferase n=1 Tax=Pichia sorbitophila (strain ATCC MYA-4447 / BCRC 22081 / CBS 7064 / NBRC 10061 / NRRL Y-12695) TaxID=559304 RepID=G8YQJ3_PICSO|nr:Piso0_000963 [Millerozyma farinosa CBS 7064]CCE78928.1 Piso0_000963 [Millerozyma farinosa CBS 7064]